jgi:hypothetical protein
MMNTFVILDTKYISNRQKQLADKDNRYSSTQTLVQKFQFSLYDKERVSKFYHGYP